MSTGVAAWPKAAWGRYMAKILTERTHAEWPEGYLTEAFGSCPGFDVPTEPPYVHAADLRGESR